MRRSAAVLVPLVLLAAFAACTDTPTPFTPDARSAPGVSDPAADRSIIGPSFAGLETTRHLVVFQNSVPSKFRTIVEELGGTVVFTHPIGVGVVEGLDSKGVASLRAERRTKYVVEDGSFRLIEPAGVSRLEPVEPTSAGDPNSAADPTTAILYSWQWNMSQIHADEAWAAGRLGDPGVTVAILDTGIDYMLPDLEGRVDLSRSASFVPEDDEDVETNFPTRDPSTDLHFHGTNVATQVSSNAWAFAGVTSRTTLMSVKVCSWQGGCPGVAEGILYAVDHGADVINMSLGGSFKKSDYPGAVSFYNRIMNYAKQNRVTVVVSAGNDASNLQKDTNIFQTYCNATNVICVAATRRNDEPASYTNFGRSDIDVAAPGGDGATGDWVYALCPQTSLVLNCAGGYSVLGVAGTSQAAPHVSGLAALAVEDMGRSPARVKKYVRNSADAIGGGNTPFFGKGRINVARAVGGM